MRVADPGPAVADPGFPRQEGGRQPQRWGVPNLLFGHIFLITMKMKEFGPRRRRASLAPPLRSPRGGEKTMASPVLTKLGRTLLTRNSSRLPLPPPPPIQFLNLGLNIQEQPKHLEIYHPE